MAKYALSKYFARGAGHVIRFHHSDVLLFQWHGKSDGTATHFTSPGQSSYLRNGTSFPSFAALLRAVAKEHGYE
jgi:hypothetical protein